VAGVLPEGDRPPLVPWDRGMRWDEEAQALGGWGGWGMGPFGGAEFNGIPSEDDFGGEFGGPVGAEVLCFVA